MIEKVDERLREWVKSVLGTITLSFAPPSNSLTGQGVNLYLLELAHTPLPRTTQQSPFQLSLRYLVTTWSEEPEEAHRLLGILVFEAMENHEFEVELEPASATTWDALKAIPRPSFVLRIPLQKDRLKPTPKFVRLPLVIQTISFTSLTGIVLGPTNGPLMDAYVEIPDLRLSTRTDAKGYFHFTNVPSAPHTKHLRITAKGREICITVEEHASDIEPLVIRFETLD